MSPDESASFTRNLLAGDRVATVTITKSSSSADSTDSVALGALDAERSTSTPAALGDVVAVGGYGATVVVARAKRGKVVVESTSDDGRTFTPIGSFEGKPPPGTTLAP
jgi:hypothetical protein